MQCWRDAENLEISKLQHMGGEQNNLGAALASLVNQTPQLSVGMFKKISLGCLSTCYSLVPGMLEGEGARRKYHTYRLEWTGLLQCQCSQWVVCETCTGNDKGSMHRATLTVVEGGYPAGETAEEQYEHIEDWCHSWNSIRSLPTPSNESLHRSPCACV